MNRESNKDETQVIKFSDIIYFILRRKWIIILIMVFMVAVGYVYSKITYKTLYTATASIVINTTQNVLKTPDSEDIVLAQRLVNTYSIILKSSKVTCMVVEKLNLDISPGQVASYISLSYVNGTQIMYLSATCPDPELAASIANAVVYTAPEAMTQTVGIGSVNIIEFASVPSAPIPNKNLMYMSLFGMAGLLIGIIFSFVLGIINNKIKSSSEAERKLYIKSLGDIIHIKHCRNILNVLNGNTKTYWSYKESFRMTGALLNYIAEKKSTKKILITSSLKKEGKTQVSISISCALSQRRKKVLLIDCNILEPEIYKKLNINKNNSICLKCFSNNLLTTFENVNKCIYETDLGFDVIPFLCEIASDENIFNTEAFEKALELLSEKYDYLIFDSSPVYTVTDTLELVRHTDGIILVIKQELASLNIIKDTVTSLNNVGADIIGFILNDIKYHNSASGYAGKYKHFFRNKTKQRSFGNTHLIN